MIKLTDKQKSYILSSYSQGKTKKQIGIDIGYSELFIDSFLRKNNIKIRSLSETREIQRIHKLTKLIDEKNHLKYCKQCELYKPFDSFYKSPNSISGLDPVCIDCKLQFAKDLYYELRKISLSKISKFHNKGLECFKCGINDFSVLEIHHKLLDGWSERKTKYTNVSLYRAIINGNRKLDDLEILCSNCNWMAQNYENVSYEHKLLCVNNLTSRKAVETIAREKNIPLECEECHNNNPDILSIEHPEGGGSLERQIYGGSVSFYRKINKGEIEAYKYRILCRNCQKKSYDRQKATAN